MNIQKMYDLYKENRKSKKVEPVEKNITVNVFVQKTDCSDQWEDFNVKY